MERKVGMKYSRVRSRRGEWKKGRRGKMGSKDEERVVEVKREGGG